MQLCGISVKSLKDEQRGTLQFFVKTNETPTGCFKMFTEADEKDRNVCSTCV